MGPVQPRTLQALKDASVADQLETNSTNRIRTLITSMRRRCRAVIDARGRHNREVCLNKFKKM